MDNLATLTHSHTVIAAKKRAKRGQIKEIIFDDNARREFLTGFHKRKLAKAEAARKRAQEREKQERLESRREQRRALREQAAENAKKVESTYASIYGQNDEDQDEEEWTGIISSPRARGKQREEEYEDEEVLAMVTVVEDFDPDTILHGPPRGSPPAQPSTRQPGSSGELARNSTKEPPLKKSKPQKIRYQTQEARKTERLKQIARRTEKAERAGGKAARKTPSKKKGKSRR
ncbi:hypothetical protein P691DRAFT_806051 [Macrolepiota fuliginosa MF-IS2]|uniref:Ribosomal RNA-processing protein 17 n=1 Tax=Macrolepiota fuliginosa MF-IS2 TaxID=1400762 RepID=A0A9P5XIC8_9AGAR|nr:hypothetical protein P691DRAFT_806051 [Macrolepiota fuliginosa MF-IS2]